MKHIQGADRLQLRFSALNDFIEPGNPVRFIDALVDKIDLNQIGICHISTYKQKSAAADIGGAPSFDPKLMLKLYLYGYLNKIRSSRKLEQECKRNIELYWLMGELVPNYHSIADFRKNNAPALKALFKLYVQFLCHNDLIGGKTLAVDGTKFRAVNSKKNNYNQKKIDKHQQFIEQKTQEYLAQLDELDAQENKHDDNELAKADIQKGLQKLAQRKLKYDILQEQLDHTDEKQISTTDADSRALIINKNIVEVAYNNQVATDDKHCLIVHSQATNRNDAQALLTATEQGMSNIDADKITVLADKGYHNGKQLQQCQQAGITTFVAAKEQPSVKHLDDIFLVENFTYNKNENTYTCPAGQRLTTKGSWHFKKRETGGTSYRFQKYTTNACIKCPLKSKCTKLKYRAIERSEYQDAVDRNKENLVANRNEYKRRQAIVEHPFGTIKRQWGYTYTLLKGLEKVDGELNLIFLCYNIKRSLYILGNKNIQNSLKNWQPDYAKAFLRFILAQIRAKYSPNMTIKICNKIYTQKNIHPLLSFIKQITTFKKRNLRKMKVFSQSAVVRNFKPLQNNENCSEIQEQNDSKN